MMWRSVVLGVVGALAAGLPGVVQAEDLSSCVVDGGIYPMNSVIEEGYKKISEAAYTYKVREDCITRNAYALTHSKDNIDAISEAVYTACKGFVEVDEITHNAALPEQFRATGPVLIARAREEGLKEAQMRIVQARALGCVAQPPP